MWSWPTKPCSSAPRPAARATCVADKIIAACKDTGAEAVHPGYGFLCENEDFARRVEEEGIVFIGPKHYSIAAMGDKIASKKLALEAKVNTIPGWNAAIDTPEQAVKIAARHRLPGDDQGQRRRRRQGPARGLRRQGGLRGLHVVPQRSAKAASATTASSSRNTSRSRATSRSRCWATRTATSSTCTSASARIQRRHQKVIEEAPSPFISDATRRAMGEQAVALAKAVKYQSAGTVEFVVGKDQSFYFLEMNTRLQVEHPVTESITGIDLVEQMIRVAAGEPLPFTQAGHPAPRLGHRVPHQCRGPVPRLPAIHRSPGALPAAAADHGSGGARAAGGGVRVDTGVYEGGEIPMYYDSMIAKLIVHGARPRRGDRAHARGAQRLRHPRRVQQHPVPGGAAGAPEVRGRRLQHRLHRRALRPGLPRRGRAARRPRLPGRAGRGRLPALPRTRRRHQRPAGRARRRSSAATSSSSSRARRASTATCRCASRSTAPPR